MIVSRYNYQSLDRTTMEGKRHYCLPSGERVPSVTTILDRTKPQEARQALQEWKNRVGEKRAQEITTEAANRGTRMHTYLERYIKTDDIGDFPSNPFAQPSWFMAAEVILRGLGNADEFWGCEVPLYYPGLYAGTTDCVGTWKGEPAILDFKQTNRPKKQEWIDDYFLQLAAYAAAHNEVHGTDIRTGVILMCVKPPEIAPGEWGNPQYQEFVLEPRNFDHWHQRWIERVEQYYESR
jgi:ATP-dependent exoDNAse (exonuclease V) beta subunit